MLSDKLARQVLTVGCEYKQPRGGIAQVMHNYSTHVFPRFNCVVNSGSGNKFTKSLIALKAVMQMTWRLATSRSIEIVHIHTASRNSFARSSVFVRLARFFGKKVVLHIHGGGFKEYYDTNPHWITSVLNRCDVVVTLSPSWQQYFQSICSGPRVCVVENIVAPPSPPALESVDDKCHMLFLGLITPEKGIFELLDVIDEHRDEFMGRLLLHIGGNGHVDELRHLIESRSLGNIVTYEGFVQGLAKEELLSQCSAFILPSHIEGLPLSILEAMAHGKPVLATRVGGIPEVVDDGVNGILLPPGDKSQLYFALKRVLDNPAELRAMGERSFELIQDYLPDNVSHRLEELYYSLLQ